MVLLQIEEPGARADEFEDSGLAVGLELGSTGLRIAASVGGNVEVVLGESGSLDFLPAVAGYDEAGTLLAGEPGLADLTAIGIEALGNPDATDARGLMVSERVVALIDAGRRRLMRLTGRPVAQAVVVVPLESTAALRMALLQAVEAGGFDVIRLVESSVALGVGGGLDRRVDGAYLHVASVTGGLALARLEVAGGVVKLVGGDVAGHVDDIAEILRLDDPIQGVIAPGVAAGGQIADLAGAPLLDGFDGSERAVIGAAILAEALS
jgi:hypothetical protein